MNYILTIKDYNGYKEFDTKKALRLHIEKLITTNDDLEIRIKKSD